MSYIAPFFLGSFHLSAFAINIQLTPIGPFPHQQVIYTPAAPFQSFFCPCCPHNSPSNVSPCHFYYQLHFKLITAPSPSQAITTPAPNNPLLASDHPGFLLPAQLQVNHSSNAKSLLHKIQVQSNMVIWVSYICSTILSWILSLERLCHQYTTHSHWSISAPASNIYTRSSTVHTIPWA